jgi:hypothetical protein
MTENDEGAVRAEIKRYSYTYSASMGGRVTADRDDDETGDAVMYEDHAAIVTALRAQLAAAESKALAVHEVLGKERDQALARLGEAEKMIVKWREWTTGLRNDGHDSACAYIRHADECSCGFWELLTPTDQFLSRDSAGGMGGGET